MDTRHLLPPAALAEMPPEDPSLPLLEFSIVGANALCVNINTRSSRTGAQWLDFAQRHFTSIVGRKGASAAEDMAGPAPAGERCAWCGGMGRIVDDEP